MPDDQKVYEADKSSLPETCTTSHQPGVFRLIQRGQQKWNQGRTSTIMSLQYLDVVRLLNWKEPELTCPGFMGTSLLSGILAAKGGPEGLIRKYFACVKRQEAADRLKDTFAPYNNVEVVCGDNLRALHSANCVILGIQPGDAKLVLGDSNVAQALAGKLIISMLAGVSCDMVSSILAAEGSSARVVRVIPSIGAQINQSCSLVSESELPQSDMTLVRWIVSQIGSITMMPEALLNTAVAISATSHALTTTAVDAITDGSVSRGVSRSVALRLAAECLRSASSLLLERMSLEELKDSMSVPRGITTEAWIHLELGNTRSAITQSVRQAVDYAQNMSG